MISDKNQKQAGGDESTNLQAHHITLHSGITYQDARDIAIDVYKANFIQLSQDAAKLATERATKLTEDFLHTLKNEKEAAIQSMNEPSMQMAIYNAQKAYATTGDNDLEQILVNILVERAGENNRTLQQITLDESLIVAPKLTLEQIDALTLNFLLAQTRTSKIVDSTSLTHYVRSELLPFSELLKTEGSTYQHLEYAGCGSRMETGNYHPIEHLFRNQYKGIFSRGGSSEDYKELLDDESIAANFVGPCLRNPTLFQIKVISDEVLELELSKKSVSPEKSQKIKKLFTAHTMSDLEVKTEILSLCPESEKLFKLWTDSPISRFLLTTVGIAIARANLKRRTGIHIDLSHWVN